METDTSGRTAVDCAEYNSNTMNFMNIRLLQCAEITLIWHIDRREVVQNIYVLQDGKLVLKPDVPIVFKPLLAGVDI